SDDWARELELGDVDSDGDLDLIIGYASSQAGVFWNDGMGQFADSGQRLDRSGSSQISLGDVDGDHDLDAVILRYGGSFALFYNDGSGIFGDPVGFGSGISNNYYGAEMGDLDRDGDLDIAIASYAARQSEVWLNDGNGRFDRVRPYLRSSRSHDLALADFDRDGDLDIFLANDLGANTVWSNVEWAPTGVAVSQISGRTADSLSPWLLVALLFVIGVGFLWLRYHFIHQ
ncbi:unnamed protein product, partial [marine sediment metagenome]